MMKFARKILAFALAGILMACAPVSAFAASSGAGLSELTVEEAARRAIRTHSGIANAVDDASVADEPVRRAQEDVWDATTSWALTNAMVSLMNAELSRSLNIRDIRSQTENVEFQITRYFNTILNMEADLEILKESLDMANRELVIAALKLSLGMMSELDYEAAQLNVTRTETNIEMLENSLAGAFRDLNSFMGVYGVDLDRRYDLQLDLEFAPLAAVNINHHAQMFVRESLMIQRAQNAADLAVYRVEHFSVPHNPLTGQIPVGSASGLTYEEEVVRQNQALRALADTRQAVRESVITMYNNLRTMELNIRASEIELERSLRQLEVLETMLELGRSTLIEVDALALSIASQENSLSQARNNHTILATAFTNPNLIMGP